MAHGYDPACGDLARAFLDEDEFRGHPQEWVTELAQHIQDAIEDWLFGKTHDDDAEKIHPAEGQDRVRGGNS